MQKTQIPLLFLEGTGGISISAQFKQRDNQYEHILGFDAFDGVISGVIDGIIKQDTRRMGEQMAILLTAALLRSMKTRSLCMKM